MYTVDALGLCADEGRVRLRKASGSCQEALLPGDFRMGEPDLQKCKVTCY